MLGRGPKVMAWLALTTVKMLERALVRPVALASNCLLVPAESTRKSVKLIRPLAALVPRSTLVVPNRGPVPEARATVTLRLPARPTEELFPYWSRVQTAG